jgi:hypothetical protein
VEVHAVTGNHPTMVEAPHVEILAEVLGKCIARAERGLGRAAGPLGPLARPAGAVLARSRAEVEPAG